LLDIAHVAHRNRVAKPGAYFDATVNVREADIALDPIIAPADKPHADMRLQHGEQRLSTNRLWQIVNTSSVASSLPDITKRTRGHSNNGNRRRRWILCEPASRLETIKIVHLE